VCRQAFEGACQGEGDAFGVLGRPKRDDDHVARNALGDDEDAVRLPAPMTKSASQ
jgi:hypothetical protein